MTMTPDEREKEKARLREIGKKGGKATKKRVKEDKDYYKRIGKLGGKSRWKTEE